LGKAAGTINDVAIGAFVGFLAGLAVAIGGAIKDSPNEGFKLLTFIRSPLIGMVEGAILQPGSRPVQSSLSSER